MSGIRDTATVTLNVNGAQAKQMMADIEAKIKQTEATVDSLKKSMADPKDIEKAKKQLKTYQKQLDEMRSATEGVNRALENELATPRELERALRTLNRQLKDMVPGSDVWDSHVERIRELKARLADLRDEVGEQETLWGKFKGWATDVWPSIDLLSRGYDAVIGGLREYVDAYADMEQEMANVRKFTGMTEDEVASLNEQFRKIDTRSSREQLNQLAQEAGRLGKTSEEDVLGFVRAADKINVALDDLGEGATLTLSKLTGIFGDEERYGTEQSLLKVGSVINELSQNCSASAPYLSNFAERMGGVGAQANMTIPQIMGFGAVLDTNAQKVEASATALSQIIVRLYQDPAKYAKVAGLDAQEFAKLMREDANAALLLFLETLQKAGGMDRLSPMFKDMGENGSRAIAALSTLATHIDQVKAQQEAANKAFAEGTSIDTEFAVQNNTVQASLDKSKNIANELRVELGEHLYPIMGHFLTTGSAIMRMLLITITFIRDNKEAVITLTLSIAAYLTAVHASALAVAAENVVTGAAVRIKGSARVATLALSVAYNRLTGNITRANAATKLLNATMRMNPFGLIVSAITVAIGFLWTYGERAKKAAEEQKRMREEAEAFNKSISDYSSTAAKYAQEESHRLDLLYKAATNEANAKKARISAAKDLQAMYPDYFKNMSVEEIMLGSAKSAYDSLTSSILANAKARAASELVFKNQQSILDIESEIRDKEERQLALARERDKAKSVAGDTPDASGLMATGMAQHAEYAKAMASYMEKEQELIALGNEVQNLYDKRSKLHEKNESLINEFGANVLAKHAPSVSITPTAPSGLSSNTTQSVGATGLDRFAEEKAWRERQEAEARIAYAKGETTYAEHTEKMNQIAVDYYQKLLDRADVFGDEKLSIRAKHHEAIKKHEISSTKQLVDIENNSYNETIYRLNESLRMKLSAEDLSAKDRETAEKVHREAVELAELNHLARLVDIYKEGSEERLRAQQAYQTAQLDAQKRHQQEYEQQEAKYARIKADVFGDNPQEKEQKYNTALEALKVVYDREIIAAGNNASEKLRIEEAFLQAQNELRREYDLQSEEDTRNGMQRGIESAAQWLKGPGGQALTGTISTLSQGMSSIFSGLSTMVQAELEIQTASINKRYDSEIQLAQGNSYKVAKLEKKKEAEIAKAKNEANKKMFAMQVIQAVAQTAQNALAAFGSAAQVPIVGYVLAPVAAAMAVAAGAIQIAAIKKQQQASIAQGYSSGGFTKPGAVNEPAGIVHAGEWVASQKLLANPVARPLIEALDHVQRTNTIGSLKEDDISSALTAPAAIARLTEGDASSAALIAAVLNSAEVISRLNNRLDEPFVTVNTVTGDHGIKQAQDEYSQLIDNVTPKKYKK
jgi:TP901 family phage tail tape measure protein